MKHRSSKNREDHLFVALCADAGIKATQQRREIYRELAASKEHPDVDMIYKRVKNRMPAVSLDTIYRNLHTLEECGIIRKAVPAGPRARYDANMGKHHHFSCRKCGGIRDFEHPDFDKINMPKNIFKRCDITFVQIHISGVCADCRSESGNPSENRKEQQ